LYAELASRPAPFGCTRSSRSTHNWCAPIRIRISCLTRSALVRFLWKVEKL